MNFVHVLLSNLSSVYLHRIQKSRNGFIDYQKQPLTIVQLIVALSLSSHKADIFLTFFGAEQSNSMMDA
jgi:fumarate reductase subunit C